MDKTLIHKYAELIIRSGVALKKDEKLIISANVDQEDFVSILVEEAYKAGAKNVYINWNSQKASKAALLYGDEANLSTLSPMELAYWKFRGEELPAYIFVDSDDPDGLKGVNADKAARIRQAKYKIYGKYKEMEENKVAWCIAGAPAKEWAMKIFPEDKCEDAIEKLWEKILYTSRALDGNGIANWEKHDVNLKKRSEYLNSLRLKELHYSSSNGTDFTVGLIPGVIFLGGGELTLDGRFFQPNIPSEEVFTSPKKGVAEGIVYASKPLVYNGVLINNFWVKFHEGKAIDVHAETGEETLRSILTLDEGSAYLGECALVPFDSPINNTGLLFYNTLYDENAACHLALGRGFTELYPNFQDYSEQQLRDFGINYSLSHVDFMIGSKDLDIVGTKENGDKVQIFHNGNWAFEI